MKKISLNKSMADAKMFIGFDNIDFYNKSTPIFFDKILPDNLIKVAEKLGQRFR